MRITSCQGGCGNRMKLSLLLHLKELADQPLLSSNVSLEAAKAELEK